jgi:hypothetical protein
MSERCRCALASTLFPGQGVGELDGRLTYPQLASGIGSSPVSPAARDVRWVRTELLCRLERLDRAAR